MNPRPGTSLFMSKPVNLLTGATEARGLVNWPGTSSIVTNI